MPSSPHQPVNHDWRELVTGCDRMLADQTQTAPEDNSRVSCDRLLNAICTFLENSTPSRKNLHLEIVRWPDNFARQLLLAGLKCDAAVRQAIRLFNELIHDISRCQEFVELTRRRGDQQLQKKAADIAMRLRRQLQYRREDLQNLGVSISEVAVGTALDPSLHDAVGTMPSDKHDPDTIVEARTPLFSWRDEQGLEQHVPAQVVVVSSNGRENLAPR